MSASPTPPPSETASSRPAESLRLPPRRQGWASTFWVLFGVAALAGTFVACALYTAPVVLSDWLVSAAAQPVPAGRVSGGKCSSKIVVHICDVTLSLPATGVTRRVNYVFTGLHAGDYGVGVMADPARPDLVTTDLGLDRLWNRTITLLVLLGSLGASVIAALAALVRNRRAAG